MTNEALTNAVLPKAGNPPLILGLVIVDSFHFVEFLFFRIKVSLKKFSIFVVAGFIPASIDAPKHQYRQMAGKSGIDESRRRLREEINPAPTNLTPSLSNAIHILFERL